MANSIVALLFIAWDMLFTHLGVWGFNPRHLCGIFIYNLPIEELLFFFCIPYASLFTYHCLALFFKRPSFSARPVSIALIVALLFLAILAYSKLYTGVTCLALGLFITYITFGPKPAWISHFYISFLVILVPFFIVNGILTGSWIDEPVVWYNNQENLGIRLFTIPLEDVFYGMLLLILNTWLYERFKQTHGAC